MVPCGFVFSIKIVEGVGSLSYLDEFTLKKTLWNCDAIPNTGWLWQLLDFPQISVEDIPCPWYQRVFAQVQHFWTILYFPSHKVWNGAPGQYWVLNWHHSNAAKDPGKHSYAMLKYLTLNIDILRSTYLYRFLVGPVTHRISPLTTHFFWDRLFDYIEKFYFKWWTNS